MNSLCIKLGFTAILISMGCVEPYHPPDIGGDTSILVVDGFINASEGSASVRLTKAVALSKSDGYPAEKGADVTIRSEKGDSFKLLEQDSGRYAVNGLAIDFSTTYQLNIRTSDNRSIISDYISITRPHPLTVLPGVLRGMAYQFSSILTITLETPVITIGILLKPGNTMLLTRRHTGM